MGGSQKSQMPEEEEDTYTLTLKFDQFDNIFLLYFYYFHLFSNSTLFITKNDGNDIHTHANKKQSLYF